MKIDVEFKSIIPELSDEEFANLENSLLAEGCRDALVVWGDILIDGHNRYAICEQHSIPYRTVQMDFDSRESALVWMIDNQRGRRNLSKQAWLDLGFKRAELLKPRAEAARLEGNSRGGKSSQESDTTYDAVEHIDTLQEAATYAGVSRDTAAKYNAVIREADGGTREAMQLGQISINRAYEETKRPHVANNSGENEWYTPAQYIESARLIMGSIDLDPASSDKANQTVQATKYYTKEHSGLEQEWAGNVWMNPPYAQPLITDFCNMLDLSVSNGGVTQAVALVNNATETGWFQTLLNSASAVCLHKARIRFIDMNGNPSGAPLQGQAIVYFGHRAKEFKAEFEKYGRVLYVN